MGPVWGTAFALATGIAYYFTGLPVLAAAAGWMATLNLFNMLPITPLDGGRILNSIVWSIRSNLGLIYMGVALLLTAVLAYVSGMLLFFFLTFAGGFELWMEWKKHHPRSMRDRVTYHLRKIMRITSHSMLCGGLRTIITEGKLTEIMSSIDAEFHIERALNQTDEPAYIMIVCTPQKTDCAAAALTLTLPPKEEVKEKFALNRREIAWTAFLSLALVTLLWALGTLFSTMPGAEEAMELLR